MGWETLVIAGVSAFSAMNTMKQGTAQAKAITAQGAIDAQNSANDTVRAGGKLTTSFLQSGLTLEGGPMDVLTQAFNKGSTDIANIAASANAQSKNTVNAARTKALTSLASSAAGASALSGAGSFASDFGSGFSDGFSNAATISTGATPGFSPSYGPTWQSQSLPWSS